MIIPSAYWGRKTRGAIIGTLIFPFIAIYIAAAMYKNPATDMKEFWGVVAMFAVLWAIALVSVYPRYREFMAEKDKRRGRIFHLILFAVLILIWAYIWTFAKVF